VGIGWTLAALFARDPLMSLDATWTIWFHILLFYLLADLMRRAHHWRRWIVEGLFFAGAVIVLISALEIVAWYWGLPILPKFSFVQDWPSLGGLTLPPVWHPVSLALNHKNVVGAYCVLLIPFAVGWARTARQRAHRWALWALAGGLAITLILSQSRGAYLGLVTMVGLFALVWLLREETRSQFPPSVRFLLDPRLLLGGAAVAAALGIWLVFAMTLGVKTPAPDDISRLDLWLSAIEQFRDHPILGVGPRQFGFIRLWHAHWELSPTYLSLRHAHNTPLNALAEGGIVVFALGTWLLVRLARVWRAVLRDADATYRRQLEGVAIALVAFSAHNMVDAFPRRTQVMIPVLIMVAYLVAGQPRRANSAEHPRQGYRAPILVALALLIAVQVAFIPVDRATLKQGRSEALLAAGDYREALAAIQKARTIAPWMDLYRLQEATVLGFLANEDPGAHLGEAIAAYEDSLKRNPAWSMGWHNLAALYAQAGRYDEAIIAQQTALKWDSNPVGYHLKLGEYYEHEGREAEAQDVYAEVLRRRPDLASSDFWRDPEHPQRGEFLASAIARYAGEPDLALDIAVFGGDLAQAADIAQSLDETVVSGALRFRLEALWLATGELCPTCYYVAILYQKTPAVRAEMVRAEQWLQSGENTAAEKAARKALFLSEGQAVWAWYVLARRDERDGADPDQINRELALAVHPPSGYQAQFAMTAYGLASRLDTLPQARTPAQGQVYYDPWFVLAARREAAGEWDDARSIYERILEDLPYDQGARQSLASLPDDEEGP
jgi:tetratricopeptide (TPR) repeat protein